MNLITAVHSTDYTDFYAVISDVSITQKVIMLNKAILCYPEGTRTSSR